MPETRLPPPYLAYDAAIRRLRLDPHEPPPWQSAALQVIEPGDEIAVGAAVRQQYATVRDRTHPGAFG